MYREPIYNSTRFLILAALVAAPGLATESLKPCQDDQIGPDARCGQITVFEDRAAGAGRTIDLNIVVFPSTGSETKEPFFALAGGPGQGATDLMDTALAVYPSVREHRDMVFVDQRGTGQSGKLDCPVNAEEHPREVFGSLFDPESTRNCLRRLKENADPTLYTTDLVVDDLDEIRRHLGYDRVFLWGTSGGTRTALVWMRRYPDRVAGALLDGITPTDFRSPSTMARGCQDAIDAVFSECREQPQCHAAYPDLESEFDQLLGLFESGPVSTHVVNHEEVQVPVEMYLGDFSYTVRGLLYRSRSVAQLPAMIHEAAATGDIQPFAQAYWQRQVGLRPYVAMGVHFGVYCSEDIPFIEENDVPEFTKGSFVGRYLFDQYKGACDAWEANPVDRAFLEPVTSDVPVLLVSGFYDPSTPISMGDRVSSHLSNSRHVKVRNEGHGAEFGCARSAATEFLTTGSLEGLGPICEDVGPIQYEVSP